MQGADKGEIKGFATFAVFLQQAANSGVYLRLDPHNRPAAFCVEGRLAMALHDVMPLEQFVDDILPVRHAIGYLKKRTLCRW